jgi:hypothetical protein
MGGHRLARGGQALKAVAALDDRGVEPFLQIADPHREGRLRQPAFLRGARKMPVPRQRQQALQIAQVGHLCSSPARGGPRPLAPSAALV